MAFRVFPIPVGPMQNVSYLLMDESSKSAMAIDSGWETTPIFEKAKAEGMRVRYAVATHGHFDHVKTLVALAEGLDAVVLSHESSPLHVGVRVKGGETFTLGKGEVKVIHTPGHTVDSICIYDGAHLFTGDTLFIGYWGRTDLPGGSPEKLYSTLHDVIMRLPPRTEIWPGHDYGEVRSRTIAEESAKNPALLARSAADFMKLQQE